jgi:site-specific recombinase XerC
MRYESLPPSFGVYTTFGGYVWHCIRHTFCSWLAMAGATIKEIQELAGHKTITMSARYAHLSPDHKLSVLDRITATATENANTKTATSR